MKKLFSVLMGVSMFGTALWAGTPVLSVNGEAVEKVPVQLTFDGDNVIVHFADESVTYDMESVVITYTTTSLSDLSFSKISATVGESLQVSGANDAYGVQVYDANGRVVATTKTVNGGATIDASAWTPGIYILRNGRQCVKLLKR